MRVCLSKGFFPFLIIMRANYVTMYCYSFIVIIWISKNKHRINSVRTSFLHNVNQNFSSYLGNLRTTHYQNI